MKISYFLTKGGDKTRIIFPHAPYEPCLEFFPYGFGLSMGSYNFMIDPVYHMCRYRALDTHSIFTLYCFLMKGILSVGGSIDRRGRGVGGCSCSTKRTSSEINTKNVTFFVRFCSGRSDNLNESQGSH